jgi:molecular chaperone GrpE (heat shock protein)
MTNNSDLDFQTKDSIQINSETETIDTPNPIDPIEIETIVEETTTSEEITVNPRIEELELELKNTKEQVLRLAADSANKDKQFLIDIENSAKKSRKTVVKNLLPFLTTINLSFSFAPKNEESKKFIEQLQKALKKLNEDLESSNVEFITPALGTAFDPISMQALNNTENEEPKVKSLASIGCKIDGQMIQPASVIIE